jgi:hypothetical protein
MRALLSVCLKHVWHTDESLARGSSFCLAACSVSWFLSYIYYTEPTLTILGVSCHSIPPISIHACTHLCLQPLCCHIMSTLHTHQVQDHFGKALSTHCTHLLIHAYRRHEAAFLGQLCAIRSNLLSISYKFIQHSLLWLQYPKK